VRARKLLEETQEKLRTKFEQILPKQAQIDIENEEVD